MPAVSFRMLRPNQLYEGSVDDQGHLQTLIEDVRYCRVARTDSSVVSCPSSATTKDEICFASCL